MTGELALACFGVPDREFIHGNQSTNHATHQRHPTPPSTPPVRPSRSTAGKRASSSEGLLLSLLIEETTLGLFRCEAALLELGISGRPGGFPAVRRANGGLRQGDRDRAGTAAQHAAGLQGPHQRAGGAVSQGAPAGADRAGRGPLPGPAHGAAHPHLRGQHRFRRHERDHLAARPDRRHRCGRANPPGADPGEPERPGLPARAGGRGGRRAVDRRSHRARAGPRPPRRRRA